MFFVNSIHHFIRKVLCAKACKALYLFSVNIFSVADSVHTYSLE